MNDQKMRTIYIEKVVVNIGVGEGGEKLIKAQKILELLTNQKPIRTISRTTNRDFGIREGMPIGCKVTLRKTKAVDFLKKAFWVKDNRIAKYSFDQEGNFSFGISDYTDFENMKYDPEIGIFGLDISTVFRRPGSRVANRRITHRKIPIRHRITQEECMNFVKDAFGVEVIG